METRHFIKTLCKQKVKIIFLSTLIALNVKWVTRFSDIFFFQYFKVSFWALIIESFCLFIFFSIIKIFVLFLFNMIFWDFVYLENWFDLVHGLLPWKTKSLFHPGNMLPVSKVLPELTREWNILQTNNCVSVT